MSYCSLHKTASPQDHKGILLFPSSSLQMEDPFERFGGGGGADRECAQIMSPQGSLVRFVLFFEVT
jgi:hypothetical protein